MARLAGSSHPLWRRTPRATTQPDAGGLAPTRPTTRRQTGPTGRGRRRLTTYGSAPLAQPPRRRRISLAPLARRRDLATSEKGRAEVDAEAPHRRHAQRAGRRTYVTRRRARHAPPLSRRTGTQPTRTSTARRPQQQSRDEGRRAPLHDVAAPLDSHGPDRGDATT